MAINQGHQVCGQRLGGSGQRMGGSGQRMEGSLAGLLLALGPTLQASRFSSAAPHSPSRDKSPSLLLSSHSYLSLSLSLYLYLSLSLSAGTAQCSGFPAHRQTIDQEPQPWQVTTPPSTTTHPLSLPHSLPPPLPPSPHEHSAVGFLPIGRPSICSHNHGSPSPSPSLSLSLQVQHPPSLPPSPSLSLSLPLSLSLSFSLLSAGTAQCSGFPAHWQTID